MLTPDGTWEDLRRHRGQFLIRYTEDPGTYRLISEDQLSTRGFSINYPLAATDLQRANEETLDRFFGKNSYQLVRTLHEISRRQGETRIGHEFYPYLALFLVVLLGIEHILANRFYRPQGT